MTQEELKSTIEAEVGNAIIDRNVGGKSIEWHAHTILATINRHVFEVIGTDDEGVKQEQFKLTRYAQVRNELRAEQRKRAGLEE
jgi:hypothetical protein